MGKGMKMYSRFLSDFKLSLSSITFPNRPPFLVEFSPPVPCSCLSHEAQCQPARAVRRPSSLPSVLGFLLSTCIFLQFCGALGQTDSSYQHFSGASTVRSERPWCVPSYHLQRCLKFTLLLFWEPHVSDGEWVHLLLYTDIK